MQWLATLSSATYMFLRLYSLEQKPSMISCQHFLQHDQEDLLSASQKEKRKKQKTLKKKTDDDQCTICNRIGKDTKDHACTKLKYLV